MWIVRRCVARAGFIRFATGPARVAKCLLNAIARGENAVLGLANATLPTPLRAPALWPRPPRLARKAACSTLLDPMLGFLFCRLSFANRRPGSSCNSRRKSRRHPSSWVT